MKNTILALGNFYGGLSGKTKEDFVGGNVKFISYMNVYNNPSVNIDCQDFVSVAEGEKQNSIRYGDVLFTGSSETAIDCGMSSVVTEEPKEPIFLNSFCFGYRFNDLSKIEPNFIKHYFRCNSLRKQIAAAAFGVTRFNLSKKDFGKIQIHIPNKTLQERIANQLDTFTTLISRLESELELRQKQYEHYREVLLNFEGDEEVEWKTLGDVCEIKGRIGFRGYTIDDQVDKGEGALSLSPGNIINGQLDFNTCTYISWEKYYESPEIIVNVGDVMFCKTGSTTGKVVFINTLPCKATINPQLVLLKEITISAKYLNYVIGKSNVQNKIKSLAGVGSVPNISQAKLSTLIIPVPSKHRQEQIVSQLDTFEQLITALKRETALRKKQYEYYREKLLTFDE